MSSSTTIGVLNLEKAVKAVQAAGITTAKSAAVEMANCVLQLLRDFESEQAFVFQSMRDEIAELVAQKESLHTRLGELERRKGILTHVEG